VKIPMRRGESAIRFREKFDSESPEITWIGRGKSSYLWVGGKNGPCYATCSRPKALINLAKQILEDYQG